MYTEHAINIVGWSTIGYITIGLHGGCHIWVRNHYDLKKTFVFVQRINTCFNSSFLDFDHAKIDLQF